MAEARMWERSLPGGAPVHRRRRGGRGRRILWSWWRVLRFFVEGGKRRDALEFGGGEEHVGEGTESRFRGQLPVRGCFWDFVA